MVRTTPVMPMRSLGDKLWPEPHPHQLEIWRPYMHLSPGSGATGHMPSAAQKDKTVDQGHIANCQSQDSNPSLSHSRVQVLNSACTCLSHPHSHSSQPQPTMDLSPQCFDALGKAERCFFFFFQRKLKKKKRRSKFAQS